MKRIIQASSFICFFAILLSCNSNSLKQDQAEKTIREYLTANSFETSEVNISPQSIREISNTNIYTQFNTSVRVSFNGKQGGKEFTLLFIFTRTPDNKWFLKSIEAVDGTSQELADWLKTRKNLDIAVQ